jgi:hypothetical protein
MDGPVKETTPRQQLEQTVNPAFAFTYPKRGSGGLLYK